MLDATDPCCQPRASMSNDCTDRIDFMEAGTGPLVVLVHSSMAGARQWSALIRDLEGRFRLRAVNLFGYGGTPAWSKANPPSLDDYAELIARVVPAAASDISLVGHSFGGAVAMQAAARQLRGKVKRLVLIEPSPFYLLERANCREAFLEIWTLANYTRRCIRDGRLETAAERFIDYWCGVGTWAASPSDRKAAFVRSIIQLVPEWDAVLGGKTTLAEWTATLPRKTLVISSAKTARPSGELVELLLRARPDWEFASVCDGGHMAPLTHPNLVNPVISDFLV